jgi:hypothetical protein
MLPEAKTITWRELTGNKFSKSLHPAMLSENGYVTVQRVRCVGDAMPDIFNVVYDKEYAVEFVSKKFIKPVSFFGKEKATEIISEAWDLYEKSLLQPHFVNESID